MRIVLLGAPGCGKGTQGHRLAKHYKVPEISTGDLLREAVAAGTPLGKAAKAVMDAGQLVSDDIVLGVIRQRLGKADARNGFILDGFPRNLAQAEQLDELLDQLGQPIDLALVMDVDVDVILQRLLGRRTCVSCGASYNVFSAPPRIDDSCDECGGRLKQRADDNEETIGNRLRIYELQTAPVIQRYREQGRLRVVQGLGEIGDVFRAVMKAVEEARPSFGDNRSAAIRRAVERTQLAQPEAGAEAPAATTPTQRSETKLKPTPVAAEPVATKLVAVAAKAEKKKPLKKAEKKKPTAEKPAGKAVAAKKTPAKKKAAASASAKKKPVKKAPVKQPAASGKKAASKKKAVAKKKVAVKKKAVAKKKPAKKTLKKKVVKQAATKKKPVSKAPVRKKTVAGKKAAARNKPVAKKKVAAKKKAVAKKKLAKKKAARRR
jgi:adenylate kinase